MKLERGMTLTGAMLREAGACEEQCDEVDRLFPGGAPLTLENLLTAARAGLEVGWMGRNLLPAPARAAYDAAVAPAWAAYDEAVAPAWAAYDEAVARAEATRREAVAPAWAAYDEAVGQARVAYREAVALARSTYHGDAARALWAVLSDEEA